MRTGDSKLADEDKSLQYSMQYQLFLLAELSLR